MTRVQHKDALAFQRLAQRYRPRLERFALRMLGDAEAARDAAQETLVRLWQKADLYTDQGSFDGFIYTLAKNECLRRSHTRPPLVCLDDLPADLTCPTLELSLGARIARAVHELPDQQRLVFILSEYEGLSYDQIALIVGCPRGTVGSRKHAAVKALARALLP